LTYLYQLKNKGAAIDEYKILTKLDNDMAGKLYLRNLRNITFIRVLACCSRLVVPVQAPWM
jgi:hypothetical protein